jgi:hypothetical protein
MRTARRQAASHGSWLALAILLLGGCGRGSLEGGGGIKLMIAPATFPSSTLSVAGAMLTVSPGAGPAFQAFTVPLSPDGADLGATLIGIPAGPGRHFSVDAYDAQSALVATGSTDADVVAGAASVLVVVMNQLPSPSLSVETPTIDLLTMTLDTVSVLGTVDFTVSAHDQNGNPAVVAWSATCGSFSTDPTADAVTWVAPAVVGTCSVSVTASVASGSTVTTSIPITVVP